MDTMEEAYSADGYILISTNYPIKVGSILPDISNFITGKVIRQPFQVVEEMSLGDAQAYAIRHGYPAPRPRPGYYLYKVITD